MRVTKEQYEAYKIKHELFPAMSGGMSGSPPFIYTSYKKGVDYHAEIRATHYVTKEREDIYYINGPEVEQKEEK